MSNLYQMFEMDVDLEREGITVNYGSVKLLLARAGGRNAEFKKLFQSKVRKYRTQIENETLDDEVADQVMMESYAETIVLGWWSRKENADGEPILKNGEEQWVDTIEVPTADGKGTKNIKFSVPECIKLFKALPDLFFSVQQMTTKSANFRKMFDEADEGNLEDS